MRKAGMVFIIVALLGVVPARAQEVPPPERVGPGTEGAKDERARKVIQLKYADPSDVSSLLANFGASLRSDRHAKVLTVVGSPAAVAAVEEAVKALDVPAPPRKDVDLTAYFVLAARQPMQAAELPSELGEVITQLKRVLNYESFQLLSTAFLRSQDGASAGVSGVARVGSETVNFRLDFKEAEIVTEGKAHVVRISGLEFRAEQPVVPSFHKPGEEPTTATSASIHTNIDIDEGQKVVVGKTALDLPDNALVLVLTAKVTD